jgi:hypothetical protein
LHCVSTLSSRFLPPVTRTHSKALCLFCFLLFACPAPPSTTQTPRLEHFIAYALHYMQLHTSVTFTAFYLQHLKARFPAAKGVLLVKGCSRFGRSTRWSRRCARTWSGSSALILRCRVTFKLMSNTTLPVQACIRRLLSLSASPCPIPSPTIRHTLPHPPRTPEASHSASTSPASSVSPQTPPDAHGPAFCKVISADSSPIGAPVIPHSHGSGPILVAWLARPLPCSSLDAVVGHSSNPSTPGVIFLTFSGVLRDVV